MSGKQERVEEMLHNLRQMQDDLHTGGSGDAAEWDELEKQLRELEAHGGAVAGATGDAAECMDDVWTVVFEDLSYSYGQR
jgi:hypothetical protein